MGGQGRWGGRGDGGAGGQEILRVSSNLLFNSIAYSAPRFQAKVETLVVEAPASNDKEAGASKLKYS